jgi:hypothetical protein
MSLPPFPNGLASQIAQALHPFGGKRLPPTWATCRCPSLSAEEHAFTLDLAHLPPSLTSLSLGWGCVGSSSERRRLARLEHLSLTCCQVRACACA